MFKLCGLTKRVLHGVLSVYKKLCGGFLWEYYMGHHSINMHVNIL